MTEEKWPPLDPGTNIQTTEPNLAERDRWTDEGWASKRWGVQGTMITHHDSHGLCYDVRHADGSKGCYDPSEFQVAVPLHDHESGARCPVPTCWFPDKPSGDSFDVEEFDEE